MQTKEQAVRRPFHEAVIEAIRRADGYELRYLATLIKSTNIPKAHDEIIAAWNQRRQEMDWGDEDLGVPADLLEQKHGAEEKAKAKEKEQARITSS